MSAKVRLSRAEAVEFSELQLNGENPSVSGGWHYGKQEIQELLDQIYGVNTKGKEVELIKVNTR